MEKIELKDIDFSKNNTDEIKYKEMSKRKVFSNIETFASQYQLENMPNHLLNLAIFTTIPKMFRLLKVTSPFSKIKQKDNQYVMYHNNVAYPFQIFSDKNIQAVDKKILKSSKRILLSLGRTLKLACSLDLLNPRVVIGNSLDGIFKCIIVFQEKNQEKVIDYERNITMSKEDYDKLFKFQELNRLDKAELQKIYYLMTELDTYHYLYEYLLFSKEILADISRNEELKYLNEKYQLEGIHTNNYSWFGVHHETLFFQEQDAENRDYSRLISELEGFTTNPTNLTKHISRNQEIGIYKLTEKNFGFFEFGLLSDMIEDQEVKKELLSLERYGHCHRNSIKIARSLYPEDKQDAFVVGGKIKINDLDYVYHSWVEVDKKNHSTVLDYNRNLAMNKEKYYKLFGAKAISKTPIFVMEEAQKIILENAEFIDSLPYLTYFGVEIMNDLKKNESILTKKKTNLF